MAKLKLPRIAYSDSKYGDGLWHLAWPESPISMICGRMIFSKHRLEKKIKDIPSGDLCTICLGAIEVEDESA